MKIYLSMLLFGLASLALAEPAKLSFRDGIEEGCSQSMAKKGNTAADTKTFCTCFADTLVKGMTEEEEKLIVAGDKKVEISLLMKNGDNLFACEKNLSKDAKF
jgi:hypothetical protein